MPAEHPGVIQFKLIGGTVHIPAVAAIELADLQEAIIQILFWRRKSKMMAHCLSHGSEQNPVVGIRAFAVHLCKPGHHLFLLHLGHFVEDTFAAHPNRHRDVGAFNDALIEVVDVSPVGIRIGWICPIQ